MKGRTISVPHTGVGCWVIALALTLAISAFGVSGVRAQDSLDKGLKVGETIPLEMTAPDQSGKTHSLKSLIGRTGLILLFTRSLDW